MDKIKPPCLYANMNRAEIDGWNQLNAPCRLLGDDRACPYAACDRAACRLCPLPAYHAGDPVTRLMEAGFPDLLGDLREVAGGCLDGDCLDGDCLPHADCVTGSGPRMSICHLAPARLRLMYLGAEWRRRTRTGPNNEETKGK